MEKDERSNGDGVPIASAAMQSPVSGAMSTPFRE
jgi:hypothetical protein